MWTLEEESQSAENVIYSKPKRSSTIYILKEGMQHIFFMVIWLFSQDLHDYENYVLDYKCAEYDLRALELIMTTPSNGEERLVYCPEITRFNKKTNGLPFQEMGKRSLLEPWGNNSKNIYLLFRFSSQWTYYLNYLYNLSYAGNECLH
jgi:hypothetical protein